MRPRTMPSRMTDRLLKAAAWGLVPVTALVIICALTAFAVNFQPLYEYGFDRYNVGAATGLDDAGLSKTARGLIGYFNSGEDYIDLTVEKDGQPFTLFNEREVLHLYDVKGLIRLDYGILTAGFLYAAFVSAVMLYRRQPQCLAAPLFWGGAFTLALIIGVSILGMSDFDAFFTQFHLLSFTNDLWLLDPSTDYLIMLFPGGFWQDAMIFSGAVALSLAAGVTALGWRNLK